MISAPHPKSRQVPSEEGQQLAKQNHAAWVETSAKQNTNVGTCPCFTPSRSASGWLTLVACPAGKVFELCLQEIEKASPSTKSEPPTSKCTIQ
jgi:Ras homolog enriched in brain